MAYEPVTPIIPNTIMQKYINGAGTWLTYVIKPADGYVLHDSTYDDIVRDEDGNETGEIIPNYRRTQASVAKNYDFSTTQVADINGNTVTAYGSRQFYTLPESSVPADHILGGGVTPDVEVMGEGESAPATE